ncbi:MAG: hypothetical protein ACTJHW_03795 [Paenalcaligenes sp.]
MAKVLQNFLIGVGLDTEKYDKGAKGVESSLFRMRTLVGFTGAAITGAFAVVGSGAVRAGDRVADFYNATQKLKTAPDYIYAYGRALAAMNGDAEDAISSISSLEAKIAEMTAGGTGRFSGDIELAHAGVDINPLRESQTGAEFLRELARQMPGLNQDQQRRVQETLGLTDTVMISLRDGVEAFDTGIVRASEMYGEFGRATGAALDYNRALAELNTRFEGIGETLAEKVLPGFTGLIDSFSGFLDKNRDLMPKVAEVVGDNPVAATMLGASAAAAGGGTILKSVGLKGAGGALSRAGVPGMYLAGGMLAYDEFKDKPWGDWWDISVNSAKESWRGFTGQNDYSHLPEAQYGPEVPVVDVNGLPMEFVSEGVVPVNQENYHEYEYQITETPSSGFVQPYEPVYAGGEVSNSEAARVSPEIIMLKEQREQADRPVAPQRVDVKNNLDLHVSMDGRAIESKVVDVVERRERESLNDFYSSVNR